MVGVPSQPVKQGISSYAVRSIPEKWDAQWFRRFITNYLQNADLRNTTAGTGIAIAGTSTLPGVVSATGTARTPAEIAAGVTPVAYQYQELDVRRYGADPSGVADSTTAIQYALNVAAAKVPSNGVVTFPAGQFKTNATLTVAAGKNVSMVGAGKYQTIIYCTAGSGYIISYTGTAVSPCVGVRIQGLWLWSATPGNCSGIYSSYVIYSLFSDLYLYNLLNGHVGYYNYTCTFENSSAFGNTGDCYQLQAACNAQVFLGCRAVGRNGFNVTAGGAIPNDVAQLSFFGCDIEGILAGGNGMLFAPVTGTKVHGVSINGNYFENVNGTGITFNGVDAGSVRGVDIRGNYVTGNFGYAGDTSAFTAVQLYNVNGFSIENNEFIGWITQVFLTNGSDNNGRVCNNPIASVPALVNGSGFKASVDYYNNGLGPGRVFYVTNEQALAPGSGASATIDLSLTGSQQTGIYDITQANAAAFTISSPINGSKAQTFLLRLRNTSGGALGAVTMGSGYHLAGGGTTWTPTPATGNSRAILFNFDGANACEISRSSGDVPN